MTRVVVVSGGGTGIGLAAAGVFAERNDQVVIIGRRVVVLKRAAAAIGRDHPGAPAVLSLSGDLSAPDSAVALCREIELLADPATSSDRHRPPILSARPSRRARKRRGP